MDIGAPLKADNTVPEYIHEAEKELPTYSEETFLRIESRRLEIVNQHNPSTQKKYRAFFEALAQFHSWLGKKLIVVVIPDEFQVNDGLYAQALAPKRTPHDYERDYPQDRIRGFCEKQGIRMLDLLPALRTAHREDRVYHLRDTHWNARGNLVAGRQIADFILKIHARSSHLQSRQE